MGTTEDKDVAASSSQEHFSTATSGSKSSTSESKSSTSGSQSPKSGSESPKSSFKSATTGSALGESANVKSDESFESTKSQAEQMTARPTTETDENRDLVDFTEFRNRDLQEYGKREHQILQNCENYKARQQSSNSIQTTADTMGITAILLLVAELFFTILKVLYHVVTGVVKTLAPALRRPKSVEGEVILVTGAGSGLGRLLSEKLALRHNAKVVCVDVNASENAKTADNINKSKGSAFAYTCDLTDQDDVEALAQSVRTNVGEVTILVNNAGVVTGKKFLESTNKMNRLTMAVNTESHFWTVKAFLPAMMKKNHGHVVTVASGAGLVGIHKLADYCASKFGAVGFAESLMAEMYTEGKDGVKSTLVCPYFISTGMFDGVTSRIPAILPILTPDYVTDKIIDAMLNNQEVLLMPRSLYLLVVVKGFLPVKAIQEIMTFLGAGDMMTHFTGRDKKD